MASDLMVSLVHSPKNSRPWVIWVIDCAFIAVYCGDEKCRLRAIRIQKVKKVGRIEIRAIVVCKRNGIRDGALADQRSSVRNFANLVTSKGRGILAVWGFQRVTAVAIQVLAVGSTTVRWTSTAEAYLTRLDNCIFLDDCHPGRTSSRTAQSIRARAMPLSASG